MARKPESSAQKVRELAESYINSGKYHCAESVLLALGETLGFPVDLKYVSGFGRGLGGTKCVCGAYSGSVVVLNLLYGADKRALNAPEAKAIDATLEKAISKFNEQWKQKNKYTCCKLLTKDVVWGSPEHSKHCVALTGDAAEILWGIVDELQKEQAKSNPSYRIRRAQRKDQEAINELLLGFKLPLDGLGDAKLWVLQSGDGELLGTAGLEIYGTQGLLRSVAVKEGLQHRGYGALLVKHVVAQARKSQVKDLYLLTTTAAEYFKKFGFKVEDRENVTGSIVDSVEFKSACPKTATLMHYALT